MRQPRLPDWLIYAGAVLVLAVLAIAGQERADAPAAPPPVPGLDAALTAGLSLKGAPVKALPASVQATVAGTAFSVSDAGVWITARHVVSNCRRVAVLVAPGRGVAAKAFADRSGDLAVLTTEGGSAPLPLAAGLKLDKGQRGYHPGFPQGAPGEAATRLLGRDTLRASGRGARRQPVLVWTEVGRTDGLRGGLEGLSGAPVLDRAGRVIGVTLAEAPRRARLYSAPPEAIRSALALAGQKAAGFAEGQPIATDNYGRVADSLRRDLRVVQVACLR